MIKIFLIAPVLLVGFSNCHKDETIITLSGKYIEVLPVNGRSQIEFVSGNLLIKSETGSISQDTFRYEITKTKIKLTPTWPVNSGTTEFYFELINNWKFKIQNLYPGIPEAPLAYMTFQK